jgi:hypothetical protein
MAHHQSKTQRTRAALISALLVAPMILGCGLLSTINQNLAQACHWMEGVGNRASALDQAKPLVQ